MHSFEFQVPFDDMCGGFRPSFSLLLEGVVHGRQAVLSFVGGGAGVTAVERGGLFRGFCGAI